MLFPRTKFADKNSIYRQWLHLLSEVLEVGVAIIKATLYKYLDGSKYHNYRTEKALWDHVSEELVDTQQSADTALHIAMDQHGADSYGAYTRVAVSCTKRGYYRRETNGTDA